MRRVLFCLVVALALMGTKAGAQVSPELAGFYSGTAKAVNYEAVPPEKFTATIFLQFVGDGSAIIAVTPGEAADPVAGTAGTVQQVGANLFGRFEASPTLVLGGRLAIKGKVGKQSLKGNLALNAGPLMGITEYKVKLKRMPE